MRISMSDSLVKEWYVKRPATAPGRGGSTDCRCSIAEELSLNSEGFVMSSPEVGWARSFPEKRRSRILTEQCRKFFVLETISAVDEKSWWRMVRIVRYDAPAVSAASSWEMKMLLGEFWIGIGNNFEPSRRHAWLSQSPPVKGTSRGDSTGARWRCSSDKKLPVVEDDLGLAFLPALGLADRKS